MTFGILGTTRALGADGAEVPLGGPRRRALLAVLLLDAGRLVATERLIDALYGEEPPAGAANAVQSQVSRLRQVLPVPLEGTPAGYRLAVAPDEVDAHRFQRLSAQGREALQAGQPALAAEVLREALALWRGPALADVGDAPFAAAQVVRLEELRTGAVEDRVEADLALGRHRSLVAELGEAVAAYPLRERLRGQLMRALYGSGRQSEALEAYEAARRELADSLGADPGPELAAVHLAILRAEPLPQPAAQGAPAGPGSVPRDVPRETRDTRTYASGDVPRETPSGEPSSEQFPEQPPEPCPSPAEQRPEGGARHELPTPLTSFVGRAEELAAIGGHVARHRLVTLIGPGGAGKTRLAVEAARRYPHDACFVDLTGVTSGSEVAQTVLGALGLRDGLLPVGGHAGGPPSAADPVARIAAALEDRPLLLVLDNCEHLVADAALLAERLLTACPRLRIVATSREALGITAEALCPVPTLALPPPGSDRAEVLHSPAVRLFAERAAAVSPGFDPAADEATADAVLRLCTALDGLPLAIELAAARLRSLPVTEIAARLGAVPADAAPYSLGVRPDALFRLLSRGSRTAQPRQRTLRGVVDWSWELLPDDERAALRRASVFAGGWTQEAAEAVCADGEVIAPEDVLDLMAGLVEKSLVVAEDAEDTGGRGRVRYRMLESIRAYGAERLAEAGETERTYRGHARYFLDFALAADSRLRGREQLAWLRLLSDDRDNLQAALHRSLAAGDVPGAMRLIAALSSYWLLRGVRYEGVDAARQVLAALGPRAPEGLEEEYALCVLAVVNSLSDPEEYAPHVAAATAIVEGMDRIARRFPVLTLLWAPFAGVPDTGAESVAGVEALLAGRADPWYEALIHLGLGFQTWILTGDADFAREHSEQSLAGFRELGDRWGLITCLNLLADLADQRGDFREGLDLLGQALVLAEELDSALDMADLLTNVAAYSLRAGDFAEAAACYERAAAMARRAGSPESLAMAHAGLADAARLRGDLPAARALAEQALAECPTGWFSSNGIRVGVQTCLGRVALAEGDPERALGCFRAAATFDPEVLRLTLNYVGLAEAVAGHAVRTGEPRTAAALLGAAQALRGGALVGPDAEATAAAVRAALGEAAAEAAVAETAVADKAAALALLTSYVTAG